MKNYYKNNTSNEFVEIDKIKEDTGLKGVYTIGLYNKHTHELEEECLSENIVLTKNFKEYAMFSKMYDNFSQKTLDFSVDAPNKNSDTIEMYEYPLFPYCIALSDYDGEESEDIDQFEGNCIASAHRSNISSSGESFGYLDVKESKNGHGVTELSFVFPENSANDREFKSIFALPINSTTPYFKKLCIYQNIGNIFNGVRINTNNSVSNCTLYFKSFDNLDLVPPINIGNLIERYGFDSTIANASLNIYGLQLDDGRYIIGVFSIRQTYIQFVITDNEFNKISVSPKINITGYSNYYSYNQFLSFNSSSNTINFITNGDSSYNNSRLIKVNITDYSYSVSNADLNMSSKTCAGNFVFSTNEQKCFNVETESYENYRIGQYVYYKDADALMSSINLLKFTNELYFSSNYIYTKIQPFSYTKLPNPIIKNSEQYMKIKYIVTVNNHAKQLLEKGAN